MDKLEWLQEDAVMTRTQSILARFDAAELTLCRRLNSAAASTTVRNVFRVASRLGDGVFWYVLITLLPLVFGRAGVVPALQMTLTGVAGVLAFRWLKKTLVRERPFITHKAINRITAPLDRYSYPSGHTLHAVSFTITAVAYFPQLAVLLVPMALLIALSRVVLGLHYPTDVLAGAGLGGLLSALGFLVASLLGS